MSLWSFQGARELEPALHEKNPVGLLFASTTRSFKTQQRTRYRGRRCSRRTGCPDGKERHQRAQRLPPCIGGIPRKEVIQPQLPLRLPCYDFTPIIDPTLDGSLPCGLGHRLRVLPTFVV